MLIKGLGVGLLERLLRRIKYRPEFTAIIPLTLMEVLGFGASRTKKVVTLSF